MTSTYVKERAADLPGFRLGVLHLVGVVVGHGPVLAHVDDALAQLILQTEAGKVAWLGEVPRGDVHHAGRRVGRHGGDWANRRKSAWENSTERNSKTDEAIGRRKQCQQHQQGQTKGKQF